MAFIQTPLAIKESVGEKKFFRPNIHVFWGRKPVFIANIHDSLWPNALQPIACPSGGKLLRLSGEVEQFIPVGFDYGHSGLVETETLRQLISSIHFSISVNANFSKSALFQQINQETS